MPLLQEQMAQQVRQEFQNLTNPVRLVVFTQEMECQFCRETKQLAEEVGTLSDKLWVESYDFVKDKDKVDKYKIDKIPAMVIEGDKDFGIRFYGIPAGYEFTTLIEDILMVSSGESRLSPETKIKLIRVIQPVNIQVFATLT